MRLSGASLTATLLICARAGLLAAQAVVSPQLTAQLQAKAGRYPLRQVKIFARDSALLVFEDSAYTSAAAHNGTWMFGPKVTPEEADRCPAERVLGRKIARVFWRGVGKDLGVQQVVVRVHGSTSLDRWSFSDMYYYRDQLEGRWAGDPDR